MFLMGLKFGLVLCGAALICAFSFDVRRELRRRKERSEWWANSFSRASSQREQLGVNDL